MNSIPNELSARFDTVAGRRELIEKYGDSEQAFFGTNEDKEKVMLSVSRDGITLTTFQENGWTRINYYDADGVAAGETFDGRWR